ncbi:MAG: hypothetical protein QUV06_09910 [Cyanobium sp. CZS 48M]|nr:hypothetical protein [Cyanobium sp. CZS48M]
MADQLELGRSGRAEELSRQAQARRSAADWTATAALELACAWLLAGDLRQADFALLEADRLDPSLALVPDLWGIWPAPAPSGQAAASPPRQQAQALATCFRAWRHPDLQAIWQLLLPQLQADWHLALEPEHGDPLLILARASALPGAAPLVPPLESELARLVADKEIAAEPAASCLYWSRLATVRPQWVLARIRVADLCLARGNLEACGRWLADPPPRALANAWFHDLIARYALECGDVAQARGAWAEAIRTAQAGDGALVAIFEQRCRQARRGPGVLKVRSLAQRGEAAAASALLQCLLADDPQWQPLRSLRERLSATEQPDSFSLLLDRAAAFLQGLGHPVPPPGPASPCEAGDALAQLEACSHRLSDYEARFALA